MPVLVAQQGIKREQRAERIGRRGCMRGSEVLRVRSVRTKPPKAVLVRSHTHVIDDRHGEFLREQPPARLSDDVAPAASLGNPSAAVLADGEADFARALDGENVADAECGDGGSSNHGLRTISESGAAPVADSIAVTESVGAEPRAINRLVSHSTTISTPSFCAHP